MGVFARLASGICPEGHGRLVHMDRETPEDLDQDQILLLQEEGSWDLIRSPRYGDSRTPRPGPELRAVLHGLYHEGNLSGEGGDPELGELCRLLDDPEGLARVLETNRRVREILTQEECLEEAPAEGRASEEEGEPRLMPSKVWGRRGREPLSPLRPEELEQVFPPQGGGGDEPPSPPCRPEGPKPRKSRSRRTPGEPGGSVEQEGGSADGKGQ